MQRPGGTPKAFCEPVITKSMPHSSIRSSSPAAEQTASTTMSVSGDTARVISHSAFKSASTAVDVSTPEIERTLKGFPDALASLRRLSTSAFSGRKPGFAAPTECSSMPYCTYVSSNLVLKKPELTCRTLSPLRIKLQQTASHPMAPEPEMINGCPVLLRNTLRVSSMLLPKSSISVVSIKERIPLPDAAKTSGDISIGPGMKSLGRFASS